MNIHLNIFKVYQLLERCNDRLLRSNEGAWTIMSRKANKNSNGRNYFSFCLVSSILSMFLELTQILKYFILVANRLNIINWYLGMRIVIILMKRALEIWWLKSIMKLHLFPNRQGITKVPYIRYDWLREIYLRPCPIFYHYSCYWNYFLIASSFSLT